MTGAQESGHKKLENVVGAVCRSLCTDCTFHCGSCTSHFCCDVYRLFTTSKITEDLFQLLHVTSTDFNTTIIPKFPTIFPWMYSECLNYVNFYEPFNNYTNWLEIPSKIILHECSLPAFSGRKLILHSLVWVDCILFLGCVHIQVMSLLVTLKMHTLWFWCCLEKLT